MAFEPGGYADKLGNRYEGRWVARQMLLLLSEQLTSITLESVGDDEAGVDLWVTRLDGTREAQQCKAENGTKFNWSLRDLASRGVLSHLKTQLQRDPTHRFAFVSSTPANQLRDLSRSASDSTGESESFYIDQIVAVSKGRKVAFAVFCECLELQESDPDERKIAFDLLMRSDFHLFADDREQREELKWMAKQLVTGDSTAVIALLGNFAEENLRKTIFASDVRQHLKGSGFEPRVLLVDERIAPRMDDLRQEFSDSIGPHLAGGEVIAREEVDQLEAAVAKQHVDAIVLHGSAGRGKSGVLYQLCQSLDESETPYLAVRLDRKTPVDNPIAFGHKLGLRDSPVNSLCAVAGDRHCVLILDQLDALRWTSAHANEGLDVCKALLREVQTMRLMGRQISVVFSCRTFDLEHDPQIKTWLKPSQTFKLQKVEIKDLPEKSVQEFVSRFNVNFGRMTSRRRDLLRSVHNLAMWAEVMESENSSPEFDSGSDLLRAFWKNRRQELEKAGFASSETQRILDEIVAHMEKRASLTAPTRIIEHHEGLATELQTLNVIHIDRRSISFCHQSHLDFLIASQASESIETDEQSIIDWLGSRSQQSLFRREQLRQLLYLLADENTAQLSKSLELLISSNEVRFHIKQLAIETAGQLCPSNEMRKFAFCLLDVNKWRDHAYRDVFHGNADWIEALHEEGRLIKMLLAEEPSDYGTAEWLINSVANRIPQVIDFALDAITNAGLTKRMSNFLLFSDAESESNRVFKHRLATIPKGVEPPYIHWEKISKVRPDRAIELLAAFLVDWSRDKKKTHSVRRLTVDHGTEVEAICAAARRAPRLAARKLTPILVAFARRKNKEQIAWKNRKEGDKVEYPRTKIPAILLRTLKAACVALAKKHPSRFVALSNRIEGLKSRSVQALLLRGWAALPSDIFADQALEWLLANRNRLRCGSKRRKPRWSEAARLIRRMSPHCSDDIFQRLEETLQRYRDPDEKRLAAWWLKYARDGYYRNGFGAAAHFLLPALDPARRSSETTGRIGVLERKFAGYPKAHFLRSGPRGGMVRSPLGSDAIRRMSDRQWLRLIKNKRVRQRDHDSAKYEKNSVTEASVEMFAQDFGIAAKRDPERFGKLALRFPADAPADYLAAILSALQEKLPPNEVPEADRDVWQPASREVIDRVLDSVELSDDNYLMCQFCRLISKRTDFDPSERVVSRLIELTTFSDPHYDTPAQVNPSGESKRERVHHFETVAINHVRALAVSAIGSILYEHNNLFSNFESALEPIVHDPNPAVRMALVRVCLPIWNFDRTLAIDWFIKASETDLWPACARSAQRLMNCAFPAFTEQLTPLIKAMVSSKKASISEDGAQEATARWLFFDVFTELVDVCRNGIDSQKLGVAKIAAQFAKDEKYSEKCFPILSEMCDDPNEEIREVSASAFRDERLLEVPDVSCLLLGFIESQAFDDNPDSLCYALHEFGGSLTPFTDVTFATVKQAIKIQSNPTEKSNRRMGLLDRHLTGVILRLYEQSGTPKHAHIRDACLDAIDDMLEHRLAPARSLLEEISK